MFSVKIWGDRGSMPVPGENTVQFGGNTACLEVRCDDRLLIIDAGSGIRCLGDYLVSHDLKKKPIDTDIFITHTHWDHIMGFPMFTPIYVPGTKIRIHAPVNVNDESLEEIIGSQLSYKYWPIRQNELSAKIEYKNLKETELNLGDGIIMKTKYLNHPVLCLGYRIEYKGKSVVTVYDHEPFQNLFYVDSKDENYDEMVVEEGAKAAKAENQKIEDFCKNADLLIHDTQYTAREFIKSKKGWGHSSYEHAINTANRANVKKLLCFHHDPTRTDLELQELEMFYQNKVRGKTKTEISFSREGQTIIL